MVRDESELASAPTRPKAASEKTTFVTPSVEVSDAPVDEMTFDDRYDVQGVLGVGGMGEVRVCLDRRIHRAVALKVMLQKTMSSDDLRRRFLREARIQGQLEHPAIVPVHDVGLTADGRPFFTMKRVRGMTLRQVLDALRTDDPVAKQRFGLRKLLTAFATVCQAVDFAHRRGVVHRDLKPENVILGDFGEVYVLDWGIAGVLGAREEAGEERI